MFALFESLGGIELVVVGIGALLLFGKDLPKVAADAGAQIAKLKRALDSTWRESGLEHEVRQIRDALPRDLSLREVARTASEKLAVRLEEEDQIRTSDPGAAAPVARGSLAAEPLPEPVEHATTPEGISPLATESPMRTAGPPPRTGYDADFGAGVEVAPSRPAPPAAR